MSCQLLLCLFAQAITLLHRGLNDCIHQSSVDMQTLVHQLPTPSNYIEFYAALLACAVIHSAVVLIRMNSRAEGALLVQVKEAPLFRPCNLFAFC